MLKHNDQSTHLYYIEETLLYPTQQGSYNIDSAKVSNSLSAADKWQNSHTAHLLCVQHSQDNPLVRPASPPVHHLSEIHVHRVCSRTILTSLHNAHEDFRIPDIELQFCAQIDEDWGHEVSGQVLRFDQNVLNDTLDITLQNGLLYCRQQLHYATSVEFQGLDCEVEYPDANQGIMPESHNISVKYMESDHDDTFQG